MSNLNFIWSKVYKKYNKCGFKLDLNNSNEKNFEVYSITFSILRYEN